MSTRRKHDRLDHVEEQCENGRREGERATVIWYNPDDSAEPERSIEEDETPGATFCFPEERDEEELQVDSGFGG